MLKSVSHRAVCAKIEDVQPLAAEFISASGKGGMTHNVHGLAKNWYLKFVQPGTAVKFIIKSSLLLMSPDLCCQADYNC
jgi:hypothetical protein